MTAPRTIIDHGTLGPDWRQWENERARSQCPDARIYEMGTMEMVSNADTSMRQCRDQAEADEWLTDPDSDVDRAVNRWAWPVLFVVGWAVIGAIVWGFWG